MADFETIPKTTPLLDALRGCDADELLDDGGGRYVHAGELLAYCEAIAGELDDSTAADVSDVIREYRGDLD